MFLSFHISTLSISGPYLIVATDKKQVGKIDGSVIYEITEFDVIPFTKTSIHLSEVQVSWYTAKKYRYCVQ